MAKVKLQNQEFEIPQELTALDERVVAEKGEEEAKKQRDINLKRWLSQVSPAATNATLNWSEESKLDGSKETVIRVTPQLGTKGGREIDALIGDLCAIPQRIHPVMELTFELKLLQISGQFIGREALPRLLSYQSRINHALEYENSDERIVSEICRKLQDAQAAPSPWVPLGF
ncbi:hypothetical protein KDA_74950 [Dictyobacter alpinus]|uniref:Uncharacterized protein n=1 Tax=Dictyobacter alpinus TaxID=2014873 RepID=A0A402BKZ4_9CHLR|nr:hypothetical protein [Dictyobacter alpinus]GCE32011.1 hypothetical protein KDA_74950 [Dictyobacter alpinus]